MGAMNTFRDRLRDEIERQEPDGRSRGQGLFLTRMKRHEKSTRRRVDGLSRPSLRSYLSGKAEPKREFIEAAAEVLGVQAAWLAYGEGERTEAEQRAKDAMDSMSDLNDVMREAFAGPIRYDGLDVAARGQVWRLWAAMLPMREAIAEKQRGRVDGGDLAAGCARDIAAALREPLDRIGIMPSARALDSYVVSACEAMLAAICSPWSGVTWGAPKRAK